jgi:thioredoxin 1
MAGTTEHVAAVTDADFAQRVLASGLPVLVEFTADWCPP